MTYRQAFDRLGNPIARRHATPLVHRIIQCASGIAMVVLACMVAWGRP